MTDAPPESGGAGVMIEHDDADEQQLELFGDHVPLVALNPCGRGRGKCLAVYELGDDRAQLRCVKCDSVAPIQFLRQQDRRRTIPASHKGDVF
jgi:hypothetical protein